MHDIAQENTVRNTLPALAERCEAATGPDIYLDADIRDALKLGHDYSADWRGWGFDECGKGIEKPKAHPYTASVNAAMTLVPASRPWTLGQNIHHWYWSASVNEYGPDNEVRSAGAFGACQLPATALCAAALRARAAQ